MVTVMCRHAVAQPDLRFDLSKIGLVVDGRQICEDKGRLQDFPSKELDRIVAAGPRAIPVLIGMIADARIAKTEEPIICFWPPMAVGDIAFCLLSDLFLAADSTKTTLPGSSWDDLLGPAGDRPGWVQLGDFMQKHSRRALQAKWQALWDRNKNQMSWDSQERCFKLRTPTASR